MLNAKRDLGCTTVRLHILLSGPHLLIVQIKYQFGENAVLSHVFLNVTCVWTVFVYQWCLLTKERFWSELLEPRDLKLKPGAISQCTIAIGYDPDFWPQKLQLISKKQDLQKLHQTFGKARKARKGPQSKLILCVVGFLSELGKIAQIATLIEAPFMVKLDFWNNKYCFAKISA